MVLDLYKSVLELLNETEDFLFEFDFANKDLLHYPKKAYHHAIKPLAIKAGKKIKYGLKLAKEKSTELDDLSRSANHLNKIKSELYSSELAKDKDKKNILNKKLAYYSQLHKNLQQQHINRNQKYIQRTKELKFKIDELRSSGTQPERLKLLEKKYEKRKHFLDKVGIGE